MKVGDNCIYPAHGVCVVQRIDDREINGKRKKFYVLTVAENAMTIMLPVEHTGTVGIRPVIDKHQALDVITTIQNKAGCVHPEMTWNMRYREFLERTKTGDAFEIARVLRDLVMLRHTRDLSFGERKMMDQVKSLLIRELAIALNETEGVVEQMLLSAMEAS